MGWSQGVTWCRNHVVCLKRNFTSKSPPPCPINYILIIQRKKIQQFFNAHLSAQLKINVRSVDVVINELTKVIMNWQINYVRRYPVGPRPATSAQSNINLSKAQRLGSVSMNWLIEWRRLWHIWRIKKEWPKIASERRTKKIKLNAYPVVAGNR